MNWYKQALLIEKEAGWKENTAAALLTAVLMILGGSTVYNAIQRTKVTEEQIQSALQDDNYMRQAKEIYEHQQQPLPPSSLPGMGDIMSLLIMHEGREPKVYMDSKGHPTVGVGFNLDRADAKLMLEYVGADYDRVKAGVEGLDNRQMMRLLTKDIETAIKDARAFVNNFDQLPTQAQLVLIDMAFNMGGPTLNQFKKMKAAIEIRDFDSAAREMKNSAWYGQVGDRSKRLVQMMSAIE
jgi:GH24 family phage-related lysozyme (muramidase)